MLQCEAHSITSLRLTHIYIMSVGSLTLMLWVVEFTHIYIPRVRLTYTRIITVRLTHSYAMGCEPHLHLHYKCQAHSHLNYHC